MEGDCTISIPIAEVIEGLRKAGVPVVVMEHWDGEVHKPDFCTCEEPKPFSYVCMKDGRNLWECSTCSKPIDNKPLKPQPKKKPIESPIISVQADDRGQLKSPIRINEGEIITYLGLYNIDGIKYWVIAEAQKPQPKMKNIPLGNIPTEIRAGEQPKAELPEELGLNFPYDTREEHEKKAINALIRYLKERE